jgi:uridine kinase
MAEGMGARKPYVIVISGSVASGKSTLAARLSELLGGAPTLIFDHYTQYAEWPKNIEQWIEQGADPSYVRVPRLKEDLVSLLDGREIVYPVDEQVVQPAEYIIVEEPSGRERQEIGGYVDLVVFVDVPQDVCVVRLVQRAIDMPVWDSEGTFERESREDVVRRLNAVAMWIAHYMRVRSMYIKVSDLVKQRADVVIDGLQAPDEIANEVLGIIRDRCRHERPPER